MNNLNNRQNTQHKPEVFRTYNKSCDENSIVIFSIRLLLLTHSYNDGSYVTETITTFITFFNRSFKSNHIESKNISRSLNIINIRKFDCN